MQLQHYLLMHYMELNVHHAAAVVRLAKSTWYSMLGPRAIMGALKIKNLPGHESDPRRPARSSTLYRLNYPGAFQSTPSKLHIQKSSFNCLRLLAGDCSYSVFRDVRRISRLFEYKRSSSEQGGGVMFPKIQNFDFLGSGCNSIINI
jgi:hypothetical protein